VIGLLIVLPSLIPGFNLVQKYVAPVVEWTTGHYFALAQAVSGH
jgi:hypothetical protein